MGVRLPGGGVRDQLHLLRRRYRCQRRQRRRFPARLFGGGGTETQSVADALGNVEDNPNDAAAVLALAGAYQRAGQTRDAASTLENYVKLQPKDADALRQLATLYQRLATRIRPAGQPRS